MNLQAPATTRLPRLGFLGVGWIGLNRMKAVMDAGCGTVAALSDPDPAMGAEAERLAPGVARVAGLEELLDQGLDGLVIATPSALHADQAMAALERGVPVFCQKPLGRTAPEVARIVETARRLDLLLGVDFSYRHTEGLRMLREGVQAGEIGQVFAVDLTFHNAYGPDKRWFYDKEASGGGCVIDLGVHLIDLLLWVLDPPDLALTEAALFQNGRRLDPASGAVEDYAQANFALDGGAVARLACSWRLHAGQEAEIAAVFHGTEGGLAFRNLGGSFYDFRLELWRGTSREALCQPPDAWGGRAICAWAESLRRGARVFDPEVARAVRGAEVLDAIYGRGCGTSGPGGG